MTERTAAKKNEKSSRKAVFAQIGVFLAAVCLVGFSLGPLQNAVNSEMQRVRDRVISQAEGFIGREIRYSSIRPSFLGYIDIRDVRVLERAEGDGGYVLAIERLRVGFSLLDLLRGRGGAVRYVYLDSPVLRLDYAGDGDLLELLSRLETGEGPAPLNMDLQIRSGYASFNSALVLYEAQDINLDISFSGGGITLSGEGGARVSASEFFGRAFYAEAALSINGQIGASFEEGSAEIGFSRFYGGEGRENPAFRVSPLNMAVALDGPVLSLLGTGGGEAPVKFLELALDTEADSLRAFFAGSAINLSDFVSFMGEWEDANQWLDQIIGGYAEFEMDSGRFSYNVNIASGRQGGQIGGALDDSFGIRISGDENAAEVHEFYISSALGGRHAGFFQGGFGFQGSVGFSPLSPSGLITLDRFSVGGGEGVSAEVALDSSGEGVRLLADAVFFGQSKVGALDLGVKRNGEGIAAALSAVLVPGENDPYGAEETVILEAVIGVEPFVLDGRIELNSFSASAVNRLPIPFVQAANIPAFAAGHFYDALVTTELFFHTDFNGTLNYSAPSIAISSKTNGDLAFLAMSGSRYLFVLDEGRFELGEETLVLSAFADSSDPQDIGFSLSATLGELSWVFDGRFLDRQTLNVNGQHGFNVVVSPGEEGGFSGFLKALDFPLPAGGKDARLSVYAYFAFESLNEWSAELEFLTLEGVLGQGRPASFRISGRADPYGASFPVLVYSDGLYPLSGRADFLWTEGFSQVRAVALLANEAAGESYVIEGSVQDGRADFLAIARGALLGRFAGQDGGMLQDAVVSGEVLLAFDSLLPGSFSADINIAAFTAQDGELAASGSASFDGEELNARNLQVAFFGAEAWVPQITVNRQGSLYAAPFAVSTPSDRGGGFAEASLYASFDPLPSWAYAAEILNSIEGRARVSDFRYGQVFSDAPFEVAFSSSGGEIAVSGGPRGMLRFHSDSEGNFFAALSNPSPVRGFAIGNIRDGFIDASMTDVFVDMDGLMALLPQRPGFSLAGGFVTADFDIRGDLANPEFFGSARATALRIRVPGFIPVDIRPVTTVFAIDGNEVSFGPVGARVGPGAGLASGLFVLDRWVPHYIQIDIDIPVASPIPYVFEAGQFSAEGVASGSLSINLDNRHLDVAGDLFANHTEMEFGMERFSGYGLTDGFFGLFGRGGEEEEAAPASRRLSNTVDLNIVTGPSVEFFWPDSRFPILRANPVRGTVLHVTADSLAGQFTVESDVQIRSGELFYFERSFYIRSGLLVFRENEQSFNPVLTTRAEIRERTDEGPVTIAMVIENEPVLDFSPRFESVPALSQLEIFTILGHNLIGADAETMQSVLLATSADVLGQAIFVRRVERQVRNLLNLDMFSVRTQILPNAIMGMQNRNVPNNAANPNNPAAPSPVRGIGHYLDNTTVFGGRYFAGGDIFLQGMVTMRHDDANLGGVVFEPTIGLELAQSPAFSIRWDFVPLRPENSWLSDNSITFTWTRSF